MKKTEEEKNDILLDKLINFNNWAHNYLKKFDKERSVLTLALIKLTNHYKVYLRNRNTQFLDEQEDIRIKFCEKDAEGRLVESEYTVGKGQNEQVIFRKKYTDKSDKKMREELSKHIDNFYKRSVNKDNDKVELKFHQIDIPASIPIEFIEPLTPFVFRPMSEAEFDKFYLAQNKVGV